MNNGIIILIGRVIYLALLITLIISPDVITTSSLQNLSQYDFERAIEFFYLYAVVGFAICVADFMFASPYILAYIVILNKLITSRKNR